MHLAVRSVFVLTVFLVSACGDSPTAPTAPPPHPPVPPRPLPGFSDPTFNTTFWGQLIYNAYDKPGTLSQRPSWVMPTPHPHVYIWDETRRRHRARLHGGVRSRAIIGAGDRAPLRRPRRIRAVRSYGPGLDHDPRRHRGRGADVHARLLRATPTSAPTRDRSGCRRGRLAVHGVIRIGCWRTNSATRSGSTTCPTPTP